MTERDWDDDTEYHEALARAERATRFGWTAMKILVALLAIAVLAPGLLVVLGGIAAVFPDY
ncbi:hypothetical protein [Streptomyces sp. NBC_01716]|uniref:hypothetical protein n=1 Tax=Streptomyces sp. NBC_01716 TaxID=2975917 RepID=UPI002E338D13|nr:hypothetical protein [Streptomyces sp. NBC_01716]